MSQHLTTQQAAAQIVGLINASPRSPRQDEIEAIIASVGPHQDAPAPSELATRIRAAMEPLRKAITVANKMEDSDPGYDAAKGEDYKLSREFAALCRELWSQPITCFDDLRVRAEVAAFELQDWPPPYEALPLFDERSLENTRGEQELRHLVAAVLSLGQRRVAIPPAGQEHPTIVRANEYRRLRAEEAALYARSKEVEEGPEHEQRVEAWLRFEREKILPVEREIWKNPTRTIEHVVLLAEIASYHENGLLDSLEEPDPHYHDDRSAAELVVGVLALAGKKPPRLGGEE